MFSVGRQQQDSIRLLVAASDALPSFGSRSDGRRDTEGSTRTSRGQKAKATFAATASRQKSILGCCGEVVMKDR